MGLFFALALVAGQVKHLILRPFYDSTPMHFRPETMHRRVFIACYEIDVGIFSVLSLSVFSRQMI